MVGNPVDVTGNVVNDPDFVQEVLRALAKTDALDAVVIYAPGYMLDRMADSIAAVASEYPRFFAAIDTGRATCRDSLRLAGIAVFDDLGLRSEEHTSELQSLMRISYAVFCLKKKKKRKAKNNQHQTNTNQTI